MSALLTIALAKEARQFVFGWGHVEALPGGVLIKDYQGQAIAPDALEYGTYDFMLKSGVIAYRHQKDVAGRPIAIGRVFECMVFTEEKMAALSKVAKSLGLRGCEATDLPTGVWLGAHIFSKEHYLQTVNGELPMFSVGGFHGKVAPHAK